jgi:hypothetical protein
MGTERSIRTELDSGVPVLRTHGSGREVPPVNFATGDNPMDVIYKDGTLEPVAMVSDDSLFSVRRPFSGNSTRGPLD